MQRCNAIETRELSVVCVRFGSTGHANPSGSRGSMIEGGVSETDGAFTPGASGALFWFPEMRSRMMVELLRQDRNVLVCADGDITRIGERSPGYLILIMMIYRFRGRPLKIRRRSDGTEIGVERSIEGRRDGRSQVCRGSGFRLGIPSC